MNVYKITQKDIVTLLDKNPNKLYTVWEINETIYQNKVDTIFIIECLSYLLSDKRIVVLDRKYTSINNMYYKKIEKLKGQANDA